MSFFKADVEFKEYESTDKESNPYRLRYIIDNDGKGMWIEPIPPLSTDYDEDIDY